MKKNIVQYKRKLLPKTPTNIKGFDEITGGGLPKGRPTLVCAARAAERLFCHGVSRKWSCMYNEPGAFFFEETEKELSANVASLGFDLTAW
jgi:circadian clock protein KaiC